MENKVKTDYILIPIDLINFLDTKGINNGKEMMLYAKILSMAKEKGFCTPSNGYLANILSITERTVSKYLTHFQELELLDTDYKRKGIQTVERKLIPRDRERVSPLLLEETGSNYPNVLEETGSNYPNVLEETGSNYPNVLEETGSNIPEKPRNNGAKRKSNYPKLLEEMGSEYPNLLPSNIMSFGASQVEEAIEYLLTNNNKVKVDALNAIVKKGIEVSSPFKEKKLYYIAKQLLKNPNTPVYVLDTFSTAYAEGRSVWRDD